MTTAQRPEGAEVTDLQETVLRALEAAGGQATVHMLVRGKYLAERENNVGYGIALAALERKGRVKGWYPSVESAGVAKVWRITA